MLHRNFFFFGEKFVSKKLNKEYGRTLHLSNGRRIMPALTALHIFTHPLFYDPVAFMTNWA